MKPFFLFSKEESETKVANNRLLSYAVGLSGQNMTYGFISSRLFVFLNTDTCDHTCKQNRYDHRYQYHVGCNQRPTYRFNYGPQKV